MQRQLIENDGVSTEVALEIYAQAEENARKIAIANGDAHYAADQVGRELEALILPILMVKKLDDDNVFNKLYDLVFKWRVDGFKFKDEKGEYNCAAVQQILLASLKNCREEIINSKFEIFYSIITHDGWKGLANSKSGNLDKRPDAVRISREELIRTLPGELSFDQKHWYVKSIEERVDDSNKKKERISYLYEYPRNPITDLFYKIIKDWNTFGAEHRAMLIDTLFQHLDDTLSKKSQQNIVPLPGGISS